MKTNRTHLLAPCSQIILKNSIILFISSLYQSVRSLKTVIVKISWVCTRTACDNRENMYRNDKVVKDWMITSLRLLSDTVCCFLRPYYFFSAVLTCL